MSEVTGRVRVTRTDILREWFGSDRYAHDHEYLDASFGKQADQVVAYLSEPSPAPDVNGGMLEALKFYRDEWRTEVEGDIEEAHLTRSWQEPTPALWDDGGRKAHVAIATAEASRRSPDLTAVMGEVPEGINLRADEEIGELIYRALYEHEGGRWECVEPRYIWFNAGARFRDLLSRIRSMKEPSETHQFTSNRPGIQGADNCQHAMRSGKLCGRWSDEPETETCRDRLEPSDADAK